MKSIKIVFFSIFFLLATLLFLQPKGKTIKKSNRCEWRITNCCTEKAGAVWECVDLETFQEPNCTGFILCPQIISPEPNASCVFEDGRCVVK